MAVRTRGHTRRNNRLASFTHFELIGIINDLPRSRGSIREVLVSSSHFQDNTVSSRANQGLRVVCDVNKLASQRRIPRSPLAFRTQLTSYSQRSKPLTEMVIPITSHNICSV